MSGPHADGSGLPAATGPRSGAVRVNTGIVQTGDQARAIQGVTVSLGRPQDVPVPTPRLVQLPKPPVKTFVGREDDLRQLSALVAQGTGVVLQSQAVHGLGGVGKSELALQYAHWHQDAYTLVWWMTADSPAAIESGLAELTYRLHPDSQVSATAQEAARWAVGWLQAHPGWLLVLDAVEQRGDVERLLGQLSGGHVLITSRRDVGWETITDGCLRLDVLDPKAAIELLLTLSGQHDEQAAAVLAGELGCLPLALQQAGAYLRQSRMDMTTYLRELRRDPAGTLQRVAAGDAAERAVARVWSVTLARIAEEDATAVELLNLLSWLASDDLPRDVLYGLPADQSAVDRALGVLGSYNMIDLTSKRVAVHRLVQAVIRSGTIADGSAVAIQDRIIDLLADAVPDDPVHNVGGWKRWGELLPHIEALGRHVSADHRNTTMLYLQHQAATYRLQQGHTSAAITEYERLLVDYERVLGKDHPNTLTTRANLAHAYLRAGQVDKAIVEFELLLADARRVLGEDHPDTLATRGNLARAYREAGRVDKAIKEFEQLLADHRRVLDEDHQNTLVTRANLAYAYLEAGRVDEAIAECKRLLVDQERVLTADHPLALTTRADLAYSYREAGRFDEAISEFKRVLADRRRVLGEEHPNTLATRGNIARCYREAGRFDEAIADYKSVIADARRVLGDDHPDTLALRGSLARAYREAFRLDKAIKEFKELLADQQRVLGDDHLNTLITRANLARSYLEAGRFDEAIAEYERLLTDRRRILGEDHPHTIATRHRLLDAHRRAGRRTSPGELGDMPVSWRASGEEYPITLATRGNLAYAYLEASRMEPIGQAESSPADRRRPSEGHRKVRSIFSVLWPTSRRVSGR